MTPSPDAQASPDDDLHWPRVRDWLQAQPAPLVEDRALLHELGLKATGPNVVDFGRAALARLEAAAEREAGARKQIEGVARANFAAQSQTHAAALDLMEARNHADLARRLDTAAKARFGLSAAVVALEKPGAAPFGWRSVEAGTADALLGPDGLSWLGPAFSGLELFGAATDQVRSVALIRMAPRLPGAGVAADGTLFDGAGRDGAGRGAICAFGSAESEGFAPSMGCELVAFLARVVERTAERWPVMG